MKRNGVYEESQIARVHHSIPTFVVNAWLGANDRGVRVVASAHGDLQSLLRNPELNTLVGGTTSVTLGDEMARATNGGSKV